ncbi:MAG: hypothetical protein ACLFVN_04280 [Phycisphaeraceae bacterium]
MPAEPDAPPAEHRAPPARCPEPPWWGGALRRLLVASFTAIARSRFRVRASGLEHFTNRPATIFVSSHKSDWDLAVLCPTIYRARRGRGPVGRTAFAAAEPMFQPGYLASYVLGGRRPLCRLLHPLDLERVLFAMRAYPVPASSRRQLRAHLRTAASDWGDPPLGELLREPAELLPGSDPDESAGQALRYRHRPALDHQRGFSIFTDPWRRNLRAHHLAHIEHCLERFRELLRRGDDLFLAPEGRLNATGRPAGVRAGLARLALGLGREVTLLPVNITYDWLTTGRPGAFLRAGPELRGVDRWTRDELEERVTAAIARQTTVTLGQIVTELVSPNELVDSPALRDRALVRARELAQRGVAVDPDLLDPARGRHRWRRLIAATKRPTRAPGFDPWTCAANELRTALAWGAEGWRLEAGG